MKDGIKGLKDKAFAIGAAGVAGALALSSNAFAAEDLSSVTTSVTENFTSIQTMAITILGSVAVVAIVLFGGIYGWKYGKKVFSVISK